MRHSNKSMTRLLRHLALYSFSSALLFFLALARPALAVVDSGGTNPDTAPTPSGGGLTNPLNNINSLQDLLKAILGAVVELGSIVLVMALVYTGFLFVVAQGNEEKIRSARSALMWTVIGGLILLGAKAIELVIENTVGKL